MSLYMTFEYKVSKRRMEQAVLRARLRKTEEGYLFDLGQGPLVDLLSGNLEDLADPIGHFLDDEFSEERGKHDPAELLPFIFQVFCEFGARTNLPFRHTFA